MNTLIGQIGTIIMGAGVAILSITIRTVGNIAIDFIGKKREVVEQSLQLGKHQQEIATAKEVWNMVDEKYRITDKVEDLVKSKADDFDKLLLAKIPYLTKDEVAELRQAIAGEVNRGKKLLNEDTLKTQIVDIQSKNDQLAKENQDLKAKLEQIKSM